MHNAHAHFLLIHSHTLIITHLQFKSQANTQ
jgi:hypothetical protein